MVATTVLPGLDKTIIPHHFGSIDDRQRRWLAARGKKMAEGYGSRTHQARVAHLTGFEVRALHREAIPFHCSGVGSVTFFVVA